MIVTKETIECCLTMMQEAYSPECSELNNRYNMSID